MTACATCATEVRANAKFCDEGSTPIDEGSTPITVSPNTAEYKQVTVLFADVVHSVAIAATVSAERLRDHEGSSRQVSNGVDAVNNSRRIRRSCHVFSRSFRLNQARLFAAQRTSSRAGARDSNPYSFHSFSPTFVEH